MVVMEMLAAVDAAFMRFTDDLPSDAAPETNEIETLWLLFFVLVCIVGQVLLVAFVYILARWAVRCLTEGNSSPLRVPVDLVRVQRFGSSAFSCGTAEVQGWRQTHEDAHAARFSTVGESSGSFYVLDGHGGDKVARAAAPSLAQKSQALFAAGAGLDGGVPADEAILDVFAAVDRLLRADPWKPGNRCGATVVGALACKQHGGSYSLKVLNCGDSRALVLRPPGDEEATAKPLLARYPEDAGFQPPSSLAWPLLLETVDHKPSCASEEVRIRAAGGFVSHVAGALRVDGRLAVSRSLGNFEEKDPSLHAALHKVSGVPDVYEIEGLQRGSTVVLACDGVWDKLSGPIVAAGVFAQLQRRPDADLGDLAAWIVRRALDAGSSDNITAMVVRFEAAPEEWRGDHGAGDEIAHYNKFLSPGSLPEETMEAGLAFLKRSGFPHNGAPVPCGRCGRWMRKMPPTAVAGKTPCSVVCRGKTAAAPSGQPRTRQGSGGVEMVSLGDQVEGP